MQNTILITGCTGNLGNFVLKFFLERDYKIIAMVRKLDGKNLIQHTNIHYFQADLTDEKYTAEVISQIQVNYPSIYAGVLITGGFGPGKMENTTMDSIYSMIALNFSTIYNVVKALYPILGKNNVGGKIITIGAKPALNSQLAPDMLGYSLSKSMLIKFIEIINVTGEKDNVRAHVIVPGTIDTPDNRKSMPDADFTQWVSPESISELIIKILENRIKLARFIWEIE